MYASIIKNKDIKIIKIKIKSILNYNIIKRVKMKNIQRFFGILVH